MKIHFPDFTDFLFSAGANSMKDMREKLATDDLKQGLRDSLASPINLLNSQMRRLS